MSARLPVVEDIRARVKEVTSRVRARAQGIGGRGAAGGPLLEGVLGEGVLGERQIPAVQRVRSRIDEIRTRIRTRGLLGGGLMAEILGPGGFRPFSAAEDKEVRPRPLGPKGFRRFSV